MNTALPFLRANGYGIRLAAAVTASGALAAGVVLALHHPSEPRILLGAFALWVLAATRWPGAWLFILPACLPASNFAPWTGWLAFEEFDLVVLGALAAGFASFVPRPPAASVGRSASWPWLVVVSLCLASTSLAIARGFTAYGDAPTGWFDGYDGPLNALRDGKSLLYALLLVPLMRRALHRSPCNAMRRIAAGMLVGTAIVVAATIDERLTYVGLFDFAHAYRTTALFWEMHVGGAAIDGYLALAWPFVAWAVLGSHSRWRWVSAAAGILLVEYACLTTFSRGLYLAIGGGLVVLLIGGARLRGLPTLPPWRRRADLVLAVALMAQLVAVLGAESFMRARLTDSEGDLAKRLRHWSQGIAILRSPADWWLGKGSGRFPLEYVRSASDDEFPGSAVVVSDGAAAYLQLSGPGRAEALAGRYAITQQVARESIAYHVAFDVHVVRPVRLGVSVCSMRLLYEGTCQRAIVEVHPDVVPWQRLTLPLTGPMLSGGVGSARTAVFSITVLDIDARADLDNISLGAGLNMLRNADFSAGLAHWFPVAKDYFVPWHIDNFYLELLIERGVFGLASVALLLASALVTLRSAALRGTTAAPYLMASLVGALLVGTVSSLLDMPRVAFLLFFLALMSTQLGTAPGASVPRS